MSKENLKVVKKNVKRMNEIVEILEGEEVEEKQKKALKVEIGACLCKIKFSFGDI